MKAKSVSNDFSAHSYKYTHQKYKYVEIRYAKYTREYPIKLLENFDTQFHEL